MTLRFDEEHLPKTRQSTAAGYRSLIALHIGPELKHRKVAEVSFSDIDALHRKVTKHAPYQANRTLAVLSKMFALAIRWKWRTDNPVRGVERNQEKRRHRYLSPDELARLSTALATHEDKQAANIVRLLLLTGARRGEALAARWDAFDFTQGVWTKPGATTKQKTEHRVPLSAPARQLLSDLHAEARAAAKKKRQDLSEFVFPSHGETGHRIDVKKDWAQLCIAADIVTRRKTKGTDGRDLVIVEPSARVHDLRHTYASVLASAGLSLPIIGALLGHSNPQTTARYAHLLDDPLRSATETAGAIISGKPSAEIVPMKGGRS